jgi:ribulose-phosphate 3-epimerase
MFVLEASLLSCNHAFLGKSAGEAFAAGIRHFHIDVMDGVYVDNLAFSPRIVSDLKEFLPEAFFHVHLETRNPLRFIRLFTGGGAASISFQLDLTAMPAKLLGR